MGTGYTRQSAATIATGEDILAANHNNEFNAIESAFNGTTGHSHDGTTGEGPKINLTTSVTGVLPTANGGAGALDKIDATTAPTTGDDDGDGFSAGSIWTDVTNNESYICLDASTGAAVWQKLTGTLATLDTITTAYITDANVTYAKIQNVSQTNVFLGRDSAGAGVIEEITATAARTILNVEDGADVTDATNVNAAGAVMNADTSTASMDFVIDEDDMSTDTDTKVPTQQSVKAYVDSSISSATLPDGDKGDVTVSSSGTVWTIDADAVTYAKIQNVSATSRILGRVTAGAGNIEELTATNVKTFLIYDADDIDDTSTTNKFTTASDISKLAGIESGATADQSASEILTAIKTVDGSGSGLDADLLDGYNLDVTNTGQTVVLRDSNGYIKGTRITSVDGVYYFNVANTIYFSYSGAALSATGLTSMSLGGNTVWTSANDGSGSGLDADTVDGIEASEFWNMSGVSRQSVSRTSATNYQNTTGKPMYIHIQAADVTSVSIGATSGTLTSMPTITAGTWDGYIIPSGWYYRYISVSTPTNFFEVKP